MDNQHRKIKGYTDFTEDQVEKMNVIKEKGAEVGELITLLEMNTDVDQRWVALAKNDLQKGFMALSRSVAKPEFF